MANIQEFKEETFTLLREQAIQLKQKQQQLTLKAEQVRFLKQTIETLEQENQGMRKHNSELKTKLDVVLGEVKKYDQEVVQKIYKQNQELVNKWQYFQEELYKKQAAYKSVKEQSDVLIQENQQLKNNVESLSKQLTELREQKSEAFTQIRQLKEKLLNMERSLDENQKQIGRMQAREQQLKIKLTSSQKQNQFLIKKCEDTVYGTQQKLKKLKQGFVKKETVQKIKQEVENQKNKYELLLKENRKLHEKKHEIEIIMNDAKEKLIAHQYNTQINKSLLDADIRTLKQTLSLRKRIGQFQSTFSEQFYAISDSMLSLNDKNEQLILKEETQKIELQNLRNKASKLERVVEQREIEVSQMQDKYNRQVESVEASYEGKIMQLSIKIKQEQKALHQLSVRHRENKGLQEEYNKLSEQHIQMKDALENTINQYQKQNERLLQQVKQLCELLNQSINIKNSLNSLKHTLLNLLCLIHYLHNHLLRHRQMRRKIYLPFILFYFQINRQLQQNKSKKHNKIRKFRICAWMIIAMKRMQKPNMDDKTLKGSSGIGRYCIKSLQDREKVQNMGNLSDEILSESIEREGKIGQIVDRSRHSFRWSKLYNFGKVNISLQSLKQYGLD